MTEPAQNSQIKIFNFSLLFAALFYVLTFSFVIIAFEYAVDLVKTDKDWLSNSIVIIICTGLVSWRFAIVHKRSFSKSEFWRLIAYCLIWSIGIEVVSLAFLFFSPETVGQAASSAPTYLWGIGYGYADLVILNFLLLLIGFGVAGKWIVKSVLR